jgi:hypothetical protein
VSAALFGLSVIISNTGLAAPALAEDGRKQLSFPLPAALHERTQQLLAAAVGDVARIPANVGGMDARGRLDRPTRETLLRVRTDSRRSRLWLLDESGVVHVLALNTSRRIRSVALPNWMYADDETNCLPDLQLDGRGTAFVSNHMQPTMWRIDAESFQVQERRVTLTPETSVDAGFSALVVADDGTIFGAMAAPGILWSIDPKTFRGQRIALTQPIRGACAMERVGAARAGEFSLLVWIAEAARFRVQRVDSLARTPKAHVRDLTAANAAGAQRARSSEIALRGVRWAWD